MQAHIACSTAYSKIHTHNKTTHIHQMDREGNVLQSKWRDFDLGDIGVELDGW